MTVDSTSKNNKYFCLNCKDQNWLVECKCSCREVIIRCSKEGYIRTYKNHHYPTDGRNNGCYKGDIIGLNERYETIFRPHHKYAHNKRVPLHRYRMELMLGRYLTKGEIVHHIDGNTHNNEEDNLMLFSSNADHMSFENKKDMSDWFCNLCGGKTRIININGKPYEHWYNDIDGHLCNGCRDSIKNFRKRMGL